MRRFILCLLSLLSLLFGPIPAVLAEPEPVSVTGPSSVMTISLAENPQLQAFNPDLQLYTATGIGGLEIQSWFWVMSILLPGVGQILMDDYIRGGIILLSVIAIGAAWGGLTILLATNQPTLWGLVNVILPLAILGIWIWNIADAYHLNRDKLQSAAIDPIQQAEELQLRLSRLMAFMQQNQLIAHEGGLGLRSQIASF